MARHLPDFHLHHEDLYMPCCAEFLMQHSELRARHPNGQEAVLVPLGALSGSVLCQFQNDHPHSRLWMELHPSARYGEPLESLSNIPVYAHAKAILNRTDPSQVEALEITYITLFAYNGHYDVIPGLVSTGAHDFDIEHCTARVDHATGELIAMWYNSHRSRDGQWVAAKDVLRSPSTGRPLAFIAKHGHGNYPTPGTVLRHFFLGNDKCSASGPVWRPGRVVLLPHVAAEESGGERRSLHCTSSRGCSHSSKVSTSLVVENDNKETAAPIFIDNDGIEVISDDPCEWVFFRGDWGQTPAPISQSWFHTAETPVSRTQLQRLFLHLWPETSHI